MIQNPAIQGGGGEPAEVVTGRFDVIMGAMISFAYCDSRGEIVFKKDYYGKESFTIKKGSMFVIHFSEAPKVEGGLTHIGSFDVDAYVYRVTGDFILRSFSGGSN